jgi:acyl transferase domain-containing protein/acyl carrier protein
MFAPMADGTFVQLQDEVDKLEKDLVGLIQEKKMTSERTEQSNQTKIDRQLKKTPIAMIGMASIFPQAKNLQEYWNKIVKKVDCITEVPSSRWNTEDYYDPDPTAADKTYCKKGGFIPDIDFNPIEFGLPPNLLEVTDISQLLSLVVAKEAMEDAGYGTDRDFNREQIGVILGAAVGRQLTSPYGARLQYPIWKKVLTSSGLSDRDAEKTIEKFQLAYPDWDENSFPGMLANVISGRIANRLNLGGTNCTIDAACASSMAALKMAVSELINGQAEMMITGGVDTDNSIFAYLCFSKTPALSKKQQTRPFDVDADGMMLGEGIGMMVLKRLEDAERDGDRIYATIEGIGTSSDGRYKSIYAPRPEGQMNALRRAYEQAGFSPTSIKLMEAHGTGTLAGDPAEFEALKEVFGKDKTQVARIALGSVKSQIGHTKAAAGAAGLIKTALALHHKLLPPTINITKPNPKFGLETSPFYLNTETRPWIQSEESIPRRAGVSAFGFGGTNYHVILEEYKGEQDRAYRLHNTPESIVLFAQNREHLLSRCQDLLTQLQSETGKQNYAELIDLCKSQNIPLSSARVGFVASSKKEACDRLQTTIKLLKVQQGSSWEHPHGIYYRKAGMKLEGKVVALFSGQGSQYLEMGRELAINFPELRQAYGQMDSLMVKEGLKPISDRVFPPPSFDLEEQKAQVNALQRTENSQPAIGVFSFGLYKIMQQAGFSADFIAGHSFGELTALWAAEVLSDEDYFFLIKSRGQAMATPDRPDFDAGKMLAVKGDVNKIASAIATYPQVAIANFNSPQQAVLAGSKAAIASVEGVLTEQGYSPVLLPVGAAFHTPLVAHAQKPFARAIEAVTFKKPKLPVYTNVTGNSYPSDSRSIQKILKEHLLNQVLFQQEIENIYDRGGYCFVEFGPRSILTNLVKDTLVDRPHLAIALNSSRQQDSDRQLREAVVQLRVAGLPLQNLDPYQVQTKIPATQSQKFSFQLNGNNYVSEKTKSAFEKALKNGDKVQIAANIPQVTAKIDASVEKTVDRGRAAQTSSYSTSSKLRHTNTMPNENKASHLEPIHSNIMLEDSEASQPSVESFPMVQDNQIPTILANKSHITETTTTNLKPITTNSSSESPMNYQRAIESLEDSIAQFNLHQQETLHLHGQYLNHQIESAKIFFHLMQQQNHLLADRNSEVTSAIMHGVENSMVRFHEHQTETLRVHEQSLHHQSDYAKNLFQLTQQKCNLLLDKKSNFDRLESSESFQPNSNDLDRSQILPNDKSLVNGNNGSHHQPIATNGNGNGHTNSHTNGHSSVVEDFQYQRQFDFPEKTIPPQETSIANDSETSLENPLLDTHSDLSEPISVTPPIENRSEPVFEREVKPIQDSSIDKKPSETVIQSNTQISDSKEVDRSIELLLQIVSDKTGYPAEMLELDMDMEADLGIDSIKRVEILSAMQEQFPDAPQANPEDLAELRTLGQIIEQMRNLATNNYSTHTNTQESPPEILSNNNNIFQPVDRHEDNLQKTVSTQYQQAVISKPEVASTESVNVDLDLDRISQTLLEVIGEKTGYPAEMLELDMDMEADLGIDSIKRVEILSAMQERFPDAPQANPEDLAELRTLGQIIESMKQHVPEKKNLAKNMLIHNLA